jgi:hypothetical protein
MHANMNQSPPDESNEAPWAARTLRFESVIDTEPQNEFDIIYWAKSLLEHKVRTQEMSIYRYYELIAQLGE